MPLVVHLLLLVTWLGNQEGWCFESAPSIVELHPNNHAQSLVVKWRASRDVFKESKATFEIQVGRTENLYIVQTTNMSMTIPSDDKLLAWTWVSELPLQCTDHSVRVRQLFNETSASDWSLWKTNLGEQELVDQPWKSPKLFPFQQVLREGSTAHFCCVPRRGAHVVDVTFDSKTVSTVPIGKRVRAVVVENLSASGCYGVSFGCRDSFGDMDEYCQNYVTFPPQGPQNLSCETRDLKTVNCSWNVGRPPNLLMRYRRSYALLVQNSSNPVSCEMAKPSCSKPTAERRVHMSSCTFDAIPGLQVYNVTVRVKNDLGEESESITFNISDRVVPVPVQLDVNPGVRHANLSWMLAGNLSGFGLGCQIRTDPDGSVKDVELKGRLDGRYEARVGDLRPCTPYSISVRCAVAGGAWRWGHWADSQFHTHPCLELDVWRQVRPHSKGRNVIVMWRKRCNGSEAEVSVQYYVVKWVRQERPNTTEVDEISGDETQTKLSVGFGACNVSVTAFCHCGSSLSYDITVPPAGQREHLLQARRVNGSTKEGFRLSWTPGIDATCGYLVEWCRLGSSPTCDRQWRKVPAGTTSLHLPTGNFSEGRRYTFDIFGCRMGAHWPLEAQTGYTQELRPTKSPRFVEWTRTTPSSVTLEWSFEEDDGTHPGFITGYLVTIQEKANNGAPYSKMQDPYSVTVDNPHRKSVTVSGFQDNREYTFSVGACTAAGVGPLESISVRMPPNYFLILVKVLTPTLLLIGLGFLLWPHRRMLVGPIKEVFRIPLGLKVKALELDGSLYEASEKIKALKVEECSCCQIEVMDLRLAAERKLLLGSERSGCPCDGNDDDNGAPRCPYCPQDPATTWQDPEDQRVMSLTNLTYCPAPIPIPPTSPYVSVYEGFPQCGAEGVAGSPPADLATGYVTTAAIPQ